MKYQASLFVSVGRKIREAARFSKDQDAFQKGMKMMQLGLDATAKANNLVEMPADLEPLFLQYN